MTETDKEFCIFWRSVSIGRSVEGASVGSVSVIANLTRTYKRDASARTASGISRSPSNLNGQHTMLAVSRRLALVSLTTM